MPYIPHGTPVTKRWSRVLHLCQTRPILCIEQSVPCSNPKGQFLWKGRKGGINTFPRVTTAVSVGAVPLFCYPIC